MKKGYKTFRHVVGRLHNRYVGVIALAAAFMVVNTQSALAAGNAPSPKPVFNFNGSGKVPAQISGPFDRVMAIVLFVGAASCIILAAVFLVLTIAGKKMGGKLALAVIGAVIFTGFAHFFGGVTSVLSYVLG